MGAGAGVSGVGVGAGSSSGAFVTVKQTGGAWGALGVAELTPYVYG